MPRSVSPTLSSSITRRSLTQRKRQEDRNLATYFKEVLTKAGVSLNEGDTPNHITQEQALVVRDISKTLRSHVFHPSNLEEFFKGLKLICKNEESFRKLLLPTDLKKDDSLQPTVQQDSVLRMLLNIPSLQDEIIDLLLRQVTESAVDDKNDTSLLRLVLTPLRYLSNITNAKALTTKLLDITEIGTFEAQLEILNLLPDVIPDVEYEETAKQLSKLLEHNPDLTGAVVDCLNSLNLSADVRSHVREEVLAQLHTNSSSKIFPILFEFVTAECTQKELQDVLPSVRNALDGILSSPSSNKDADTKKALICNRLQSLLTARKSLYEGWVAYISNVRAVNDVKPVDLFMLFMLHSTGKMRKSTIEALFKKRVKLGLFKVAHFEALFKDYFVTQTMKDYLSSIMEVGVSILRFYTEPVVIECAETIFRLVFGHSLINRLQRQDVIYNLTLAIGMSDKKSIRPILKILIGLLSDVKKLQEHTVQLMGLLEKMDTINLSDVKLIFELLCNLTCGEHSEEAMSGLKDEIHMIIRKQLSSSKKSAKHRGIIGSIMMIKALVLTSQDQSAIDDVDDSISLDELPSGGPREAACLLELTNTCTLGNPDSVGLFYDELAFLIITTPNIQQVFLVWLYQLFTNSFQNSFVTETVPQPVNDLVLSMQFSLNTSDEVETQIAVNIGEMTLKLQPSENCSVIILASLFRLLRLIYYKQHEGDLASIDALLGCSVIMPDLEDVDGYDTEQLKQVADCVFHCINWFRELINAFVTQKSRQLRNKVLERLSGVVKLQGILEKCLANIPDHKLPLSYFDALSQGSMQRSPTHAVKVSRPKKKQKVSDTTNLNNTVASTSAVSQPPPKTGAKKKPPIPREFRFREMDTDIILLLRYPIQMDENVLPNTPAQSQSNTLNIEQFIFLISDLVHKLRVLMKPSDLGLSHITAINLEDLISDCLKLFPSINNHLQTITGAIENLLKSADNCRNAEVMSTSQANTLKNAFALIMECYSLIFGWSGFQHQKNLKLLKDCLKNVRVERSSQLASVKSLCMAFTDKLVEHVDHCLTLTAALSLVEVMQGLYEVRSHPDLKKRIAVTSGKLLSKRWYNQSGGTESGKDAYLCVNKLLKAYLGNATSKTICGVIGTLQEQADELKSKEDSLPMLASIDKLNFHVFFRCLCTTLVEIIRTEISSLTNEQHLVLWRMVALSMQGLMSVVKKQETKTNLVSYLKNGIAVLKIFLASGIPILEIVLPKKTTEVIEVFKLMQASTRFLHQLCCYSKFTKDVSLVAYVPQFRQVLESLIYRVKAALAGNGCSDAFWMGTLKNKNWHGEEILSQSTIRSNDSGDEEELPPDDEEEEIEIESNVVASDNESTASEII
ncbi:hypothetical protein PPYR_04592 [Photinus pyralis]|uniref:Fanconi anemia group D2 protein n=1 Tax=Photinus pyralis TaxID=7054 RepID=A0A5N4AYK9_PHOPY|nr:Fanconi anemia group D2 protein [Photinus pyralis]KAB0802406.1 hypothetical protein PPYR_04592 [Photinus pyralis]